MKKKIIYFLLMLFNPLHATDTKNSPIDSALKEQCTQIMQEMLQNMLSGLQHGQSIPQQEAANNSDLEIVDDLDQRAIISTPDESETARGVTATVPFTINASVFGGANRFFVGPNAAGTLSQAVLTLPSTGPVVNLVPMAPTAMVHGAAGTASPLLNQPVALLTLAGNNPLIQYNQIYNQSPVVAIAGDPASVPAAADLYYVIADDGSVILENETAILDAAGTQITKQIVQIAGTLGSQPLLFAAVSDATSIMPTIQAWGDPAGVNRGIAVLQPNQDLANNPQGLDVVGQAPHNGAASLSLLPSSPNTTGPVSFLGTPLIGNTVAMYWDDPLQSLYIGLSAVTRPAGNNTDGCFTSIVVGTEDEHAQLTLAPITQMLSSNLFNQVATGPTNSVTDILGFSRTAGQEDPFSATALNLGVMHSSTGRDYLIMNGGVDTTPVPATSGNLASLNTQVYAIPLVPSGSGAATGFAGQTNGDGPFVVVTAQANMPQSNQLQTTVGQDPQLLSFDMTLPIQQMQVVGDTVYVSVAGTRDSAHVGEAGIFSSTALFSQNGIIRDWTPWKREMGRPWATYGFGFDTQTSNFWTATPPLGVAPTTPPLLPTEVLVTQWGLGDSMLHQMTGSPPVSGTLQTQIEATFGGIGGVYGLFNFDSGTNGFALQDPNSTTLSQRSPQFSMMVATGNSSVMLIQTGNFVPGTGATAPTSVFVPTTAYVPGINIFSYTGQTSPVLQQLGTITCAEVSRLPLDNNNSNAGWLFVGGTLGLAVFTDPFEGQGWLTGSTEGLNQLVSTGAAPNNFPGAPAIGFQFVQLLVPEQDGTLSNPFQDVRKIVSDQNKYLYVLTVDTLYRFQMISENFQQTANNTLVATITADYTIVATIQDLASRGGSPFNATQDQFFDLMVLERDTVNFETFLLLGTSQGLYKNTSTLGDNLTGEDFETINWRPIRPSNGVNLGPTLQFDFISRNMGNKFSPVGNGVNYANGNLRVLALDTTLQSLACYRFDINFDTEEETVTVVPFTEPYIYAPNTNNNNGNTPYFFKLGTFDSALAVEFIGQRDFFVRTRDVFGVESGFANSVPVVPNPSKFLPQNNIYPEIDLKLVLKLPFIATPMVLDTASGSRYVAGEFGVRVNE